MSRKSIDSDPYVMEIE